MMVPRNCCCKLNQVGSCRRKHVITISLVLTCSNDDERFCNRRSNNKVVVLTSRGDNEGDNLFLIDIPSSSSTGTNPTDC